MWFIAAAASTAPDCRLDAINASSPPRGGITPDARRETAINKGLAKRLEQLAIERERRERAALRDDAEFSTEFLNAARRCFEMIDKDDSGTLEKDEIVRAVRADQVANAASYDRAPFNLRGLRGTAVFVCLVCGGAGSSNDRFTLRAVRRT